MEKTMWFPGSRLNVKAFSLSSLETQFDDRKYIYKEADRQRDVTINREIES